MRYLSQCFLTYKNTVVSASPGREPKQPEMAINRTEKRVVYYIFSFEECFCHRLLHDSTARGILSFCYSCLDFEESKKTNMPCRPFIASAERPFFWNNHSDLLCTSTWVWNASGFYLQLLSASRRLKNRCVFSSNHFGRSIRLETKTGFIRRFRWQFGIPEGDHTGTVRGRKWR